MCTGSDPFEPRSSHSVAVNHELDFIRVACTRGTVERSTLKKAKCSTANRKINIGARDARPIKDS